MNTIGLTILSGIWWTLAITQTSWPNWARVICFIMGVAHTLIAVLKNYQLESRVEELAIALERHKKNLDD